MTPRVVGLIAVLLAPSLARAKSADIAAETAQIAADLLRQSPLHGKKIALGSFTDADGKLTALSDLIAADMELALVERARKGGDFQTIDRRNFGELSKEWELNVNGSVDDDNLIHAGKLLGADVLCVGKYTRIGKKIVLRTTFVGSEKGDILGANSTEMKLDGDQRKLDEKAVSAAPMDASRPIGAAKPGEALKVELATDKDAYAVGDKMKVNVKVNQDCYLTIIDVGPSNKATVLFPNLYAQNNAVKAGSVFTIPDPTAGFEFEVSPPTGREIIRAIASKEPSVDLNDLMEKPSADAPFGGVKKELGLLTRDIHVKAKKAKPGEWSESVLNLTIR